MKKLVLLLPAILLTGCLSTAPVVPNWPEAPADLLKACPDLNKVDPANDKLSTIIESVSDNYQQYYDCKSKVDNWIEWYNGQQKIWEKLK
jgi:hypothetical protein